MEDRETNHSGEIRICLVSTEEELHQIKALQHANQQPQLTADGRLRHC